MLPVSDLRSDSPLVLLCVSCVYLGLYTLCDLGWSSSVPTLFRSVLWHQVSCAWFESSDFCLASSTVTPHRPEPRLPFCRIVSDSRGIFGPSAVSPRMSQHPGCGLLVGTVLLEVLARVLT